MKAILEFEFPEDRSEHDMALHGLDWALAAFDMDQWLRGKLKHGHEFKSTDEALENAREILHDFITEHGVSLDDIV